MISVLYSELYVYTMYIKRYSACTYVRFDSSETTGRANIKLSMIDHHSRVSVIRVFVTS